MVKDIADTLLTSSPANTTTQIIDGMPPVYPYIAYAGLRHIRRSAQRGNIDWLKSAEEMIQRSLDTWFQRWSVDDAQTNSQMGAREGCVDPLS